MSLVTLAEVASINPVIPKKLRNWPDRTVPFVPMSRLSEQGRLAEDLELRRLSAVAKGSSYFENGDVILAKITPCMENGKAAFVSGLRGNVAFGSTEFHVLRPSSDLDGRYLFYMLWNQRFRHLAAQNMTGTAGQKRVPTSFLERYRIALPPLPEQRRIAAIFDKADAIRRKRQETIRLTEELIQSAYLHLVGPANPNQLHWRECTFSELASGGEGSMRTGPFGSALRHSEFVDSGIAVLGIDNSVANRFRWAERRYITEEKYQSLKRYTVRPRDVIITIMGTTGRSAVVPPEIPTAISTKHLAAISVNGDKAHPEFVSNAVHRDAMVLAQIRAANRGAIMAGLNLGIIKELVVRLPPMDLQRRFADIAARARAIEEKATCDLPGDLFGSLVQRAFSGAL